MQTDNYNEKELKDISSVFSKWIIIAACFGLGILDMLMLRDAVASLMNMNNMESSLIAFALATVANFTSLLWGMNSGKHAQAHSINKYSVADFLFWTTIGISYVAIRLTNIIQDIDEISVPGEIIQILILAILYTSTGLTISANAREIFDRDTNMYRKTKKEFEEVASAIAEASASIQQQFNTLETFNTNYDILKNQYEKIKESIYKAEESAMSDIVGKVTVNNPEINPTEAHKIMNEILAQRNKK